MTSYSVADAEQLMQQILAPWIAELGLKPVAFDGGGGDFVLPGNPALVHAGNVVCGQAIASAADTAIVITLSALNGRFRVCTTVDFATHFIRPIPPGDADIRVDILANGKRMAYARVEFRAKGNDKLAATVTSTFAYLGD